MHGEHASLLLSLPQDDIKQRINHHHCHDGGKLEARRAIAAVVLIFDSTAISMVQCM